MKNWINTHKRKLALATLFLLFCCFILLLFLPATYFDKGQALCLSKRFLNVECYGCGMTRAIQHLIHLDFKGAAHFNKLSFIVLPLIIFAITKDLLSIILKKE